MKPFPVDQGDCAAAQNGGDAGAPSGHEAMEWIQRQAKALFGPQIDALRAGSRIAIAGAAVPGVIIAKMCKARDVQVVAFLDDYVSGTYDGLPSLPFHAAKGLALDAVILATIRNEKALLKRLAEAGYDGQKISRKTDDRPEAQKPGTVQMSKSPKPLNGLPGRDWPLNVQLQTSSICNARCVICPYQGSWHRRNPGLMSDSLFQRILADLEHYRLGKFCLYLQNEPLADKRWFDLAEQAISRLSFQRFEISTNCSLLDKGKADRLCGILQGIPHEVWISFHGSNKENYEKNMGLDFDSSVKNMAYLLGEAKKRGVYVRVHACGTPARKESGRKDIVSRDEFLSFLRKFKEEHGLDDFPISFFPFHDRAGHLDSSDLRLGFHRESLKDFYCHRIDTWIHVLYNGDVVSCCNDYHRATVMGNMERESLIEFFRSKPYMDFRAKALGLTDSEPDFICKSCAVIGG